MNIKTKSNEIAEFIQKASSVFLMAHKDLDLDAINSCIGIDYYIKLKNKKSYIIIDDVHQELGVKKVLKLASRKIKVIKSDKVKQLKDEKSILIILDTNKAKLVQNPELIDTFDKVINIDHHDKKDDSLTVNLSIIDEDSSSTCEMITNFLKEENIEINKELATLLLAGIVLDTNNYKLKTNAETFYTSYYLMNCQANISDINELLKQDIHDYIKRQKIISSVKVINNIAIGRGLQRSEYKKEEIAKTADSLLTFSKIKASFVVARISKELIGISARSASDINVGKILEKFGGGGGEAEAAASIENCNINKVIEDLINIIKNL